MTAIRFRLVFAGLALGFLVGCAHQVPANPNRAAIPTQTNKLPLNVGVYFSSTFEGYQLSESKWGDTWNFTNLGQASAYQFREALEEKFIKVVKLKSAPGKQQATEPPLDLVLVPEIQAYNFDIPLTKFQVYPATITYKLNLYEGDTLVASPMANGVGDTTGSPGPDFSENPSRSASRAIEEGVNKAIAVIVDSPQVQNLVKQRKQADAR